jgi:enterochelin esterase-like enzyme
MKKLLTTYFVFLMLLNTLMAQDLRIRESLSFFSKILGQEVKYSVCLPEDYFSGKHSYPVVYLLHGLGDNETAWLEDGQISPIADKSVHNGEIVPMIYVMPQGFRTYYVNDFTGKFRYQDMFIQELIPLIDAQYRTIADGRHRATMGYSMGGYGALILPLKNPEVIGTCVPMSISIRTDEQYMKEDSSEWNQQWGRIFGGIGILGNGRITDYYKQNNPFHILAQPDLSKLSSLKIYIANGDDEQTLCRSNEELHILLSDKHFPHEFRVQNGGHEFSFWRSALPNSLRFISDAFEGKPYRGDLQMRDTFGMLSEKQLLKLTVGNELVNAFVPAEYKTTSRLYPVVYMAGNFTESQRISLAGLVNQKIENNEICPMLLVFLPECALDQPKTSLPEIEQKLRIRPGYRFRSIFGFQEEALKSFTTASTQEQFSSCILADGFLSKDSISNLISEMKSKALEHTALYIVAPDKGKFYEGNGNIHMLLRDKDIRHEYRVQEGAGGFDWFLTSLPEICILISNKFHQ